MIYKTHHIVGLIGAEAVLLYFKQPVLTWETPVAILAGYFAGSAADVDQPQSFIGQKVWPLSEAIQAIGIRHRTFTHSILFLGLLWWVLLLLPIPSVIRWAILVGYASHPFIDLFNEQGVELLWPIRWRISLLPGIVSIPVDSFAETILRGILTGISGILFITITHPVISRLPIIGPISHQLQQKVIQVLSAQIQSFL